MRLFTKSVFREALKLTEVVRVAPGLPLQAAGQRGTQIQSFFAHHKDITKGDERHIGITVEGRRNAVLILGFEVDFSILDGLLGSHHGELGIAVQFAGFLTVEMFVGVKAFHLTGEMGFELLSIK